MKMERILREIRRRGALFIWPSISICILSYFTYHLIQGDRGILAWQKLQSQLESQEKELDSIQVAHNKLEHRVQLLRHHICPDLLEEQAKKVLGYIHPTEMIIRLEDLPS